MWSLQNPYHGRDQPWIAWKHLLHQARWNLILPVYSPQLWVITAHDLQHTMGKVQICPPSLGPRLCTGHLPMDDGPDPHPMWWSDRHHRWCSFSWKDDREHDKHLHKFMRVTCEHGLVFNKDKCAVKQTSVVFLDVSMMPMELIVTLKRSVQSTRCQHPRQQLNYRSSSN